MADDFRLTPSGWSSFYDAVAQRPPHDTPLKALALFEGGPDRRRFAIDLGCGEGRDAREMLRWGWCVLAIDRESEAIRRLLARTPDHQRKRLHTQVAAFEVLADLPACDLVNASYSLPFCAPGQFPALWRMIVAAIRPRGRFAGNLFGVRDGWADDATMTFHTRAQTEALLSGFKVEWLLEEERDGHTATGEPKHWHVFHIVAFKR